MTSYKQALSREALVDLANKELKECECYQEGDHFTDVYLQRDVLVMDFKGKITPETDFEGIKSFTKNFVSKYTIKD
ncbi:hypothetical protein PS3A_37690 [Pseudomonas sp. 3A(2025)]